MTSEKLYIVTVFRDITPEMFYNWSRLVRTKSINPVKAYHLSTFEKGDNSDNPDTQEVAARNKALAKVPVGEAFLVVDSDEVVVGNVDYLKQTIQTMKKRGIIHCDVAFFETDLTVVSRPRLIIKQEDMEYRDKHYKLFVGDENILRKGQKITYAAHSIAIMHTKKMRCPVNVEKRIDYDV